MIKVYFATKNKHKVEETKLALKPFNIEIIQLPVKKIEPEDQKIEEVAVNNAKILANQYNKPVIVDDTGIFFHAFENFPGSMPKRVFEQLGYPGLLKKVEGLKKEDRGCSYKCAVGYCEPGKEPKLFVGEVKCTLTEDVDDLDIEVLPYERITLYKDRRYSQLTREEKDKFSHRAQAFRKLGEYLSNNS